jgi:hypothetical protein
MSSLTFRDRMVLEKAFGMGSGSVLNFSDRTFQEFIWEHVGRDVYGGAYSQNGTFHADTMCGPLNPRARNALRLSTISVALRWINS